MFDNFDLGGALKLLGALGKAGSGFMASRRDQGYPMGLREAMESDLASRTYLAAAADPNSPYFRNIAATEEERGRNSLLEAIGQLFRSVRSETAMGRRTINPERRDEGMFKALSRGFYDAGLTARDNARKFLLNAAGVAGKSGVIAGRFVAPTAGAIDAANRTNRLSGSNALFKNLEELASLKGFGVASTPSSYKSLWGGSPQQGNVFGDDTRFDYDLGSSSFGLPWGK